MGEAWTPGPVIGEWAAMPGTGTPGIEQRYESSDPRTPAEAGHSARNASIDITWSTGLVDDTRRF